MVRYRRRLKIIADVLGVVREGAKKTRIMYQANLSYKLLTRYLKDVINMGLVKTDDGNTYELTDKGFSFLRKFGDYHGRRLEVEKELDEIEEEKMKLEDIFLNAKSTDTDLKGLFSKKGEKR